MRIIDDFPYPLLIALALFMAGAPFVPEPHLVEKMRMLADGTLSRPVDIFDVFWHLLPTLVLALKFARGRRRPPAD